MKFILSIEIIDFSWQGLIQPAWAPAHAPACLPAQLTDNEWTVHNCVLHKDSLVLSAMGVVHTVFSVV